LIPIGKQNVRIRIPAGAKAKRVRLLASGALPEYEINDRAISLKVPSILDHEVVAIDLDS